MIRLSRLTDYGVVLMTYVASHPDRVHTATEVAAGAHLPLPTVSKLMRILAREGLLDSQRGVKGGYRLARPSEDISLAGIVSALEGPIALTLCTVDTSHDCDYEPRCPVRRHLQKINRAIRKALEDIPLSEMTVPAPDQAVAEARDDGVTAITARAAALR